MIETIQQLLVEALSANQIEIPAQIPVERSRQEAHGHFTSNIALSLAKNLGQAPLQIATRLKDSLPQSPLLAKVEIKAPGFINFFLSPAALQQVVIEALQAESDFGRLTSGTGKKVQVEFVSANPTGPLTIGHGRQAVLGDAIARILSWAGYQVEREYYYNDAGRQMRILAHSVFLRYRQLLNFPDKFPDDHYQGEYIREIAAQILAEQGDRLRDDPDNTLFQEAAENAIFSDIKNTLHRLDIEFDNYYNEKSLYSDGRVDDVLQRLQAMGASYEKDGAIWFRAGEYGGAEDRVLWKSVADEATYRLPDIAYHTTKFARGYDLIIDIFGADHHATYPDVLAGLKALGYDISRIRVLLHQFVTLTHGSEKIKMSTRKANYVTVDELIDEVGKDVVRYFFLMRGMKSHLNFDLTLAKTEGEENPVFYLQYAHARISSVLRNALLKGFTPTADCDLALLSEPITLALLNTLSEFQEVMHICVNTCEPQHLTNYLQRLAATFHKFYTEHRVITSDRALSQARLALIKAVQIGLRNGLQILGITAPEKM